MFAYDYIRVATATPQIKVADVTYNTQQIIHLIDQAQARQAHLVVFPELAITGYTNNDLFFQKTLLEASKKAIDQIQKKSESGDGLIFVGAPLHLQNRLYNCAIAISKGQILGIIPKSYLPNYNEYYEKRWFASSSTLMMDKTTLNGQTVPLGTDLIFEAENHPVKVGAEICEDLWAPIPPSSHLTLHGANLIVNLSASNEVIGKSDYRRSLVKMHSAKTLAGYAYCSSGYGESTTDLVFGGHHLIYENGQAVKESPRFYHDSLITYGDLDIGRLEQERLQLNTFTDSTHHISRQTVRRIPFTLADTPFTLNRPVPNHPFVPSNLEERQDRCDEIFKIQSLGLAKRLEHIGSPKAVVGISGGLDSTLALLVTVKTFDFLNRDHKDIIAVTMPGFGTSNRTYTNAMSLMKSLGVTIQEIVIDQSVIQHFKDIDHDPATHNVTYENAQARERTQILMDLANKLGGLVIGTGDLSELALGWATYNGDHMSMYGVNTSIPKTLVRYLVDYVAQNEASKEAKDILEDILATPVSPELLPLDQKGDIEQRTEALVGPYELHDFFLYYVLRFGFSPHKIFALADLAFQSTYSKGTIKKWLIIFYQRFFAQQFKRSCLPDGPKVGSINLSPRGDWRMPSDSQVDSWLKQAKELQV